MTRQLYQADSLTRELAVQNKVRFDYIDALRGYAILLVIFVHSSQMIGGLQAYVYQVGDQGARGVQLFRDIVAVGSDVDLRGTVRTGSVLIGEMTIAGD